MSPPKCERKTFESEIFREFWETCGYTSNVDGTPNATAMYIKLFDYNQTDIKGFIQYLSEYHPEKMGQFEKLLSEYITLLSIHENNNSTTLLNQVKNNEGVL